jgi:hypothetical protein
LTDDGTPVLDLTAAQALNYSSFLDEITNSNYTIAIVDSAQNIADNIKALSADARVSSITFSDEGTPTITLTAA